MQRSDDSRRCLGDNFGLGDGSCEAESFCNPDFRSAVFKDAGNPDDISILPELFKSDATEPSTTG